MKKIILSVFTIAALGLTFVGCKDHVKQVNIAQLEKATITKINTVKFIANVAESSIDWTGFKPTGSHAGQINISEGFLNVNEGKIESGTFTIDMNSITEKSARLVGHLKSADFFDVEQFPNASFEITGSSVVEGKTMLSGNLTLKNITESVSFAVTTTNENDVLTLSSETFTIDRTKWGIKYKSKSIFGDIGDKFINDDIELKITVKATKA